MTPTLLNRSSFLFFLFLLLFSNLLWSEEVPQDFHHGVVLPLYGNSKTDYTLYLKEIKDLGASHVSFLIRCYLNNNRSNHIISGFGVTPSDHTIEEVSKTAKKLDLKITFLPVVFLAFPKSDEEWRGNINPTNWEEWWDSYFSFIRHYAYLATRCKADALSVGSELATTEMFKARWEKLIQQTRTLFAGQITYAANWDHFEEVTFASELDFLGISGYYEIADNTSPKKPHLIQKWKKFVKDLTNWANNVKRPLVFMEVGYASQNGCASKPWNYLLSKIVDLEEQDLCFEVLFEVWEKIPCFGGLYIYHWWGEGGPKDYGYSIRGKPAAKRIKKWFLKRRKKESQNSGQGQGQK